MGRALSLEGEFGVGWRVPPDCGVWWYLLKSPFVSLVHRVPSGAFGTLERMFSGSAVTRNSCPFPPQVPLLYKRTLEGRSVQTFPRSQRRPVPWGAPRPGRIKDPIQRLFRQWMEGADLGKTALPGPV